MSKRAIDLVISLALFALGVAGVTMSLDFPGRAGLWPMFVTGLLCCLVAVHLFRLWREPRG